MSLKIAGMLSPAPSDAGLYAASDTLPQPRSKPLPYTSAKRTDLINYLDNRMLNINRRYAKSFAADKTDHGLDAGYTTFEQVLIDVDGLLDVVWVSATPSIQLPYLLALAGCFRGFMHSFHFDQNSFALARKLDQAFASFLETNAETISTTEKVRIRSMAEETRLTMVEIASRDGWSGDGESDSDSDDDFEMAGSETAPTSPETAQINDQQSSTDGLGKIYEKTLVILGGDLTSLTIPFPEEQREPSSTQYLDDVESFDL